MSFNSRVARLERMFSERPDACPLCGADWPGSVYVEVLNVGDRRGRCFVCGEHRPIPKGNVRVFAEGLIDAI